MRGLSGGERSRLSLAKMMLFPRNVLALDEPTNHLDIPARETLEEALGTYEGTLLVVSHDRYFLDKVCNRLLVFDEDGRLEAHLGNYSDWRARRESARQRPSRVPAKAPAPAPRQAGRRRASRRARRTRIASGEQRRLRAAGADAGGGGGRLEQRAGRRCARELAGEHGGDWQKLHELADKERSVGELLARRMDEWETASRRPERRTEREAGAGG